MSTVTVRIQAITRTMAKQLAAYHGRTVIGQIHQAILGEWNRMNDDKSAAKKAKKP